MEGGGVSLMFIMNKFLVAPLLFLPLGKPSGEDSNTSNLLGTVLLSLSSSDLTHTCGRQTSSFFDGETESQGRGVAVITRAMRLADSRSRSEFRSLCWAPPLARPCLCWGQVIINLSWESG